jgi:hypothetical protein
MMEAGVLISKNGEAAYWHEPAGRTSGSLPDSPDLWSVIWELRDHIGGFAHSHPGWGVPGPSQEDVTTFAAVEAALGRRLNWWIISHDKIVLVHHLGKDRGRLDYAVSEAPWLEARLSWLPRLRRISYEPEG